MYPCVPCAGCVCFCGKAPLSTLWMLHQLLVGLPSNEYHKEADCKVDGNELRDIAKLPPYRSIYYTLPYQLWLRDKAAVGNLCNVQYTHNTSAESSLNPQQHPRIFQISRSIKPGRSRSGDPCAAILCAKPLCN